MPKVIISLLIWETQSTDCVHSASRYQTLTVFLPSCSQTPAASTTDCHLKSKPSSLLSKPTLSLDRRNIPNLDSKGINQILDSRAHLHDVSLSSLSTSWSYPRSVNWVLVLPSGDNFLSSGLFLFVSVGFSFISYPSHNFSDLCDCHL